MKSTIAVCSFPGTYDVEANQTLYAEYMREAAGKGVEFLVFPELSIQGYPRNYLAEEEGEVIDHVGAVAEPIDGPSVTKIAALAKDLNITVVAGLIEAGDRPGINHNTAVLISPDGVLGSYRKVHLPLQERIFFWPGSDWPVIQTSVGNVGLMICYDKAWPEAARELFLRGADMFVMPTAWWHWDPVDGADDMWLNHYVLFERARAVENNRWFLSSNLVGELGGKNFFGVSQIIDPCGRIIASTPYCKPGLAVAEVDIAGGIRESYHLNSGAQILRDWRPDTYHTLTGARPPAIFG